MEAVTFSHHNVIQLIHERTIPLRVAHDQEPLSSQFQVKHTPNLVILDVEGHEVHRHVGFLPPEEFVPFLLLGLAKVDLARQAFDEALEGLEMLLRDYPRSGSSPEAVFLEGQARYKKQGDPKPLREAYEALAATFPENEWTKKASRYRFI